ncbi:hypothetical protein AQUCO_00300025v1 [Aquilegia coerulea]|uniref:Uncharacterized protein n=1 Tax=Aquilegia coerulea TaxID=218851 RepID=A0A2G5EWY7_AQUCA|nr:hypothetical protein AQUCO_00300025v1 [Aquilegia coerulea]
MNLLVMIASTQVKDLEVELETTIEKSKENLHHAILIERFRLPQMQWDIEELRRKSLEMQLKLKAEQVLSLFGVLCEIHFITILIPYMTCKNS